MECGACATNCPVHAITVTPGVGCAAYIIQTWIRGKKAPDLRGRRMLLKSIAGTLSREDWIIPAILYANAGMFVLSLLVHPLENGLYHQPADISVSGQRQPDASGCNRRDSDPSVRKMVDTDLGQLSSWQHPAYNFQHDGLPTDRLAHPDGVWRLADDHHLYD